MTAVSSRSLWHRWRFRLNGFLLILPLWYIYLALTPEFPAAWPEKSVGPVSAIPMPADYDPPYAHEDIFVKDFYLHLCEGCMDKIRTAYLNIGTEPLPISERIEGVVHGNRFSQEAHAVSPPQIGPDDKLWMTVQDWSGRIHHAWWDLSWAESE